MERVAKLYIEYKSSLKKRLMSSQADDDIIKYSDQILKLNKPINQIKTIYQTLTFVISHFTSLESQLNELLSGNNSLEFWTQCNQSDLIPFIKSAQQSGESNIPKGIHLLKTIITEPKLWKIPSYAESSQSFLENVAENWEQVLKTHYSSIEFDQKNKPSIQTLLQKSNIPESESNVSILNQKLNPESPKGLMINRIPRHISKDYAISSVSPDIHITDALLDDIDTNLLSF